MVEIISNIFVIYLIIAFIYYILDILISIYVVRKYNQEAKLFNKKNISTNQLCNKLSINIFIAICWGLTFIYNVLLIVIRIMIGIKPKHLNSFKQWYLNYYFNDENNYPYYWETDKQKNKNKNKTISNNTYSNLKQELWLLKHIPRKYKYITKDKNGNITVHEQSPLNIDGYWFSSDMRIFVTKGCLEIINVSLENPLEIKNLISLIEKILNENSLFKER